MSVAGKKVRALLGYRSPTLWKNTKLKRTRDQMLHRNRSHVRRLNKDQACHLTKVNSLLGRTMVLMDSRRGHRHRAGKPISQVKLDRRFQVLHSIME